MYTSPEMYDARAQLTVQGIPTDLLPLFVQIKQQVGTPISWLAAVCERTGWNQFYRVNNAVSPYVGVTRQFGIAGIWAGVPEILYYSQACVGLGSATVVAGWYAYARWGLGFWTCGCAPYTGISSSTEMTREANLWLAGRILADCGSAIRSACGGAVNEMLYLRWQLGCRWLPVIGASGCMIPPTTPQAFINEMNLLVDIQRIYAAIYDELPIVPGPVECPPGYVWDPEVSACVPVPSSCTPPCPPGYVCNEIEAECVPSACPDGCPPGYVCNETTGQCVPIVPPPPGEGGSILPLIILGLTAVGGIVYAGIREVKKGR